MSKPIYKIIANKPTYQSYGQYVTADELEEIWDKTGLASPFTNDDLYTVIGDDESFTFGNITNIPLPSGTEWGSIQTNNLIGNGGQYVFRNWRPVSNVFIGNKYNLVDGTYLQQYYKFSNPDYRRTSAPNIVHLYFDFYENNNVFDLIGTGDYINLLRNFYVSKGASGSLTEDDILNSAEAISQKPRLKIINWDWKEGDNDIASPIEYTAPEDGGFLIDENGNPIVYSHQYDSPGIKTIKALVYLNLNSNELNQTSNYFYYKKVTIKLNMGLDDIFIEDFSSLGGPDFTFIPWPHTTPIIGGTSEFSDYYSSLRRLIKQNPFSENEQFDKFFAQKSFNNDETGKSLPGLDLQQFRLFSGGGYDMNYILGINSSQLTPDEFTLNHYSDEDYWNGNDGYKFNRNFPFEIFIDDVEDLSLRYNCLVEFTGQGLSNSYLTDTSSNGIKGILFGDYNVRKDDRDIPAMRDSVMSLPKIKEDDNGAI